jgi:type 1 glutamine amidotransferase
MKIKTTLPVFLLLSALLALCPVHPIAGAEAPRKIKVLLVTGDDVEPAHNWREVSQAVKETLLANGRFDVRLCEDPGVLDSAASLGRYDVVFLQFYNAKTPTLSDSAKNNLAEFVRGGKGMVVAHLSSASFKEWTEFPKLCGRVWVMGKSGHGPRGVFQARVINKEHPITQGLADFQADDELYAKLQGDAPITLLVEADSDWSKRAEPLAFTVEYGKGLVFHETFGHDARAVRNESVARLIQRGCEWAASGKVK